MRSETPASILPHENIHYLVADGEGSPESLALVCLEGLLFDIPEGLDRMVVVLTSERPHKDSFYIKARFNGKVSVDHTYGLDLPPYSLNLLAQFPNKQAYFSLETEDGEVIPKV